MNITQEELLAIQQLNLSMENLQLKYELLMMKLQSKYQLNKGDVIGPDGSITRAASKAPSSSLDERMTALGFEVAKES